MNLHELLRAHALHDLRRLVPSAHYWMRDHSPQADRELTEPLLREPVRFELTPRENVAARALSGLATYEILSRAILAEAYPVQDVGQLPAESGLKPDQEQKIAGRWEVFRRTALVYARIVNDPQLIEGFQPPELVPDTAKTVPAVVTVQADTVAAPTIADSLPWWQKSYDILEMAQNIGATLQSQNKRPSNTAIAGAIAQRIADIERGKGRTPPPLAGDTVRGVLTGWRFKPD